MSRLLAIFALLVVVAGCRHSGEDAARLPPPPSTWPDYPRFSERSCWARPRMPNTGGLHSAPSFASRPTANPTPPKEIVRRVLERFGDRRFVRGIQIGPPPPRREIRGFFPGKRPPRDALWAYIAAPAAVVNLVRPNAREVSALQRAQWEAHLVGGALRDDFCDAGGSPLAGWSVSGQVRGVSDATFAFGQRFPNPSPEALRKRAAEVGKDYGFQIVSLQLLRPRELAPLLVVETDRSRKAFVRDVRRIMSSLNPRNAHAVTFEGFFFEARDASGVFVRVWNVQRGAVVAAQWSWHRCYYPYTHSTPIRSKPCPDD